MLADTLARLQGASKVQAVEGGCFGATEGLEALAVSALHSSSGHTNSLALSPSQGCLFTSVWCFDTTTGTWQRLPYQEKVSHIVKDHLFLEKYT